MRKETEDLLEHVLAAVMAPGNGDDTDTLALSSHLRQTVPDARAVALIRALLSADQVIQDTFNGNSPGRLDAKRARALAYALTVATDDAEASRTTHDGPLRLSDLPL